eukprot:scaffold414784_cov38-Prasinocladus_malaysianus.AAC.1
MASQGTNVSGNDETCSSMLMSCVVEARDGAAHEIKLLAVALIGAWWQDMYRWFAACKGEGSAPE